jgi:hypothetical protein
LAPSSGVVSAKLHDDIHIHRLNNGLNNESLEISVELLDMGRVAIALLFDIFLQFTGHLFLRSLLGGGCCH